MESTTILPDSPPVIEPGVLDRFTETVEEFRQLMELEVKQAESCPAAGGGCKPQACPSRGECYQLLNEWSIRRGKYQRADVTVYDRIEITVRYRDPERVRGEVERLAAEYRLSRQSIYDIAKRIAHLYEPRLPGPVSCLKQVLPCGGRKHAAVEEAVWRLSQEEEERIRARMLLTMVFPGGVTMRPAEDILEETPLVSSRSASTVWRFVNQAGSQAEQILQQVDYAGVKAPLILVALDETFFNDYPILFVVEPMSLSIVKHYVPPDGDWSSQTWESVMLILKEDQRLDFWGGIGDAAKPYPGTFKLVLGQDGRFQEDVFHPKRDMGSLQRKLENSAYRAFGAEYKAEKQCKAEGTVETQETWRQAQAQSVQRAVVYDTYTQAMFWAAEAFELVDLKSGEIRDRDSDAWALNEAITLMSQVEHDDVAKMSRRLARHQPYLLCCLDWLQARLAPLLATLHTYLDEPELEKATLQLTARRWRLQHAVESMKHSYFRSALQRAEQELAFWIAGDDFLKSWCAQVHTVLEWVQRASSAVENINSIFKPLVEAKKHFDYPVTCANFVALFVLWHNLRVFKEGKRAGYSPFDILGVDLGERDWRTLLGYPPVQLRLGCT